MSEYDCDYLFTPYGRQKEMECYELEMKEREMLEKQEKEWEAMKQRVDDCGRWVNLELDNDMHHKKTRLNKCIAYFEEAKGIMEDELVNLPEDDWREDR